MQVFRSFKTLYSTLFHVIPHFTKIFALFFGYLTDFPYLCIVKTKSLKYQCHTI